MGLVCLILRKPIFDGYLKKEGAIIPSFLLSKNIVRQKRINVGGKIKN